MFQPDRLYMSNDKELDALAPYSTRAHWRVAGKGPAYVRLGKRVAYRGSDLNEWLDAQTVRPRVHAKPAA